MKRPVTMTERRHCEGLFQSETVGLVTGHDKKKKNTSERVYTGWNSVSRGPVSVCPTRERSSER